jgi:hypothetical protein
MLDQFLAITNVDNELTYARRIPEHRSEGNSCHIIKAQASHISRRVLPEYRNPSFETSLQAVGYGNPSLMIILRQTPERCNRGVAEGIIRGFKLG